MRLKKRLASEYDDVHGCNNKQELSHRCNLPADPDDAARQKFGRLNVVRMDTVPRRDVDWLWPGWIARGKLHIAAGMPDVGKTQVICNLAAAFTTGGALPDGTKAPLCEVVILAGEDDLEDTIGPRLDNAGANSAKVHVIRGTYSESERGEVHEGAFNLVTDGPLLARCIETNPGIRIVFADPLQEYLLRVDANKYSEVKQALAPTIRILQERGVALVGISHFGKQSGGSLGPALYRSLGSVGFVASARIVWAHVADRDNPERKLMLPMKCNIGPRQRGLAYTLSERGVAWESDRVDISADEALAPRGRQAAELDTAIDWMKRRLASGDEVESSQLEADALAAGISKTTFWRARKDAGVNCRKGRGKGAGWMVSLPATEPNPADYREDFIEHVTGDF